MTILDFARSLVARGISVVPVPYGSKKPNIAWKEYQLRLPTDTELAAWFGREPRNIAVIMGAISGLVAVDADSPEAVEWVESHLPFTPMQTITPRGRHFFYRHPGTPVKNGVNLHPGVDVRGDGGYVIGPYSRHVTGGAYESAGWEKI